MRTIIINTLGSELRKNPLFYLPFQADQFHWIEKSLQDIGTCPPEISAYQSTQGARQDYHLIFLISLAQLPSAELAAVRQIYVEMLTAYLNENMLYPLCQQLQQPPVGVSVVFMLQEKTDGQGDVELERELDRIFGFTEDMDQLPSLILKNRQGLQVLDVSALFSDAIAAYQVSLENQHREPLAGQNYALEQLRRHLLERIKAKQDCLYIPIGMDQTVKLNTEIIEFAPRTTEWDLCCVDLQINLSEHLQEHLGGSRIWQLQLTAHDAKDIHSRIQIAISRVRYLQQHAPRLAFYAMEANITQENDITAEIWEKLGSGDPLPGVAEAQRDAAIAAELRESAVSQEKESLAKELRRHWLLINLEKRQFEGYYNDLQAQYAPEAAAKQQKNILDICASTFAEWRRKLLTRKVALPSQPKEIELPIFDEAAHQREIAQAQRQWAQAAVEQLEDYTDVREKAEEIKAQFRKAYRLWPDGEFKATGKFCVYSIVLAILFILQMLLPYIGITMGQDGVELSRYVHFFLSLLLFITLYGVGILLWMRALCKHLEKLTRKMYYLLQDSHFRRRQSIIRAVESYGKILPKCALCYERQQILQMIHEENLQRKERFNSHAKLLSKADELLHELCSLLRMPDSLSMESVEVAGGINFELAPSHPENMPYYVFLSEKWGRS